MVVACSAVTHACGRVASTSSGRAGATSVAGADGASSEVVGASGGTDAASRSDVATCLAVASPCTADQDCCTDYCWNGLCQTPGCMKPLGRGCLVSEDCCYGGAGCLGGYCSGLNFGPPQNGTCKVPAEVCKADDECCSGICMEQNCQTPGCVRIGDSCTTDAECCSVTSARPVCLVGTCKFFSH